MIEWAPKTEESLREIPTPARSLKLLAELQVVAPEGAVYCFIPPRRIETILAARELGIWREGQAVLNNLARDFGRIVKAAAEECSTLRTRDGKATISFHDFRRTAMSAWARVLPPKSVMEFSGHAVLETVMAYYVETTADDRERAKQAAAIQGPAKSGDSLTISVPAGHSPAADTGYNPPARAESPVQRRSSVGRARDS